MNVSIRNAMKKAVCAGVCTLIAAGAAAIPASAEAKLDVLVRVEGVDGNLYCEKLTVTDDDGTVTAADALAFADKQSDALEIKGIDTGYISEVNGVAAGKFGGYDGWYYCVNGEAPSVGASDYTLADNDSLTLYYGGFPCQIPYIVTDKLESDGVIAFKSNDVEYDESWNATNVTNPVEGAAVTLGGEKYTTDKNGEIAVDKTKLSGEVSVQIEKKDASGAPAVLRFAPDTTVRIGDAEPASDTESEQATDTEAVTDTDKATDTDSDKPSDTDKNTDSDKASDTDSSKTTTSTSNSGSTVKTTTAASTAVTAPAAAAETTAAAATGDGRIYFALTVFGVAAIVIVAALVLKLFTKKEKE